MKPTKISLALQKVGSRLAGMDLAGNAPAVHLPHAFHWSKWRLWLPSRGNVLFTLLVFGLFLGAPQVSAFYTGRANATGTAPDVKLPYQGRITNKDGTAISDCLSMVFRLYAVETGGEPLGNWSEHWDGTSCVKVRDGLFNVQIGSLTPIPAQLISDYADPWLGITVGNDEEMTPRVQLGSVLRAATSDTVNADWLWQKIVDLFSGQTGSTTPFVPAEVIKGEIKLPQLADEAKARITLHDYTPYDLYPNQCVQVLVPAEYVSGIMTVNSRWGGNEYGNSKIYHYYAWPAMGDNNSKGTQVNQISELFASVDGPNRSNTRLEGTSLANTLRLCLSTGYDGNLDVPAPVAVYFTPFP